MYNPSIERESLSGQAVIEGVMMRGQKSMAVAVRHPSGEIIVHSEPLKAGIYTSPLGKLPFIRGLARLWDTLVLGTRTLMFSANIALAEVGEVEFSMPMVWGTLIFSLLFAILLFFVAPLLIVQLIDRYITSTLSSNILEGLIRLGFFLAYVVAIGLLPDIRRVFAYHGAEHKTVNAYEDGAPLEPRVVETYSTAHTRCGTGFLLLVLVLFILVSALLGRPPLVWRILSRIILVPIVVSVVYELIKLSAARYHNNPLVRAVLAPNLALQSLTTRQPDDSMLEVAIAALKRVLADDESARLDSTESRLDFQARRADSSDDALAHADALSEPCVR